MKSFLSKFIPFFAGFAAFSLFGLGPVECCSVNLDLTDILVWVFRSFIALAIAIIAYFLKGMIDDNKKEDDRRDKQLEFVVKLTTAHEVMYQIWLEDMVNSAHDLENGTRKTDKVHRLIQSLAETNKND
jgi:phosphate/sulfate permease